MVREPDITNLKQLLSHSSDVIKATQVHLKETGGDYDIFSILGLTSDELTHSKIIASLLDPKGKHNQGEIFHDGFLQILKEEKQLKINFSSVGAVVNTEYYIGEIDNKSEIPTGGRIDILIADDNGHKIVIENKVFAEDQYRQLERYYSYLSDNAEIPILYLTPLGHKPSSDSIKNKKRLDGHYLCVSYKDFIIKWLNKCESQTIPDYLRNIIQQYQNIVKKITNQSYLKMMRKKIITSIEQDKESLESALQIVAAYEDLKIDIERQFWQYIFDDLEKKNLKPLFSAGFKSSQITGIESYVRKYLTTKKGDANKLIGIDIVVGQYDGHDLLLRLCAYNRLLFYLHFRDIPDNRDKVVSIIEKCLPDNLNWNAPNSKTPKEWITWCRPRNKIIDIYDFGEEMRNFLHDKTFADQLIGDFLNLRTELGTNLSKQK